MQPRTRGVHQTLVSIPLNSILPHLGSIRKSRRYLRLMDPVPRVWCHSCEEDAMKLLKHVPGQIGLRGGFFVVAVAALLGAFAYVRPASGQSGGEAGPISDIALPHGYRDWALISVATVGGPVNDMRAKLGNDVALRAFRDGKTPFPDGTIIARLAWSRSTSDENNTTLRPILERGVGPDAAQKILAESFVAGAPTNVQLMVKDSTKYASTGGWGFAQFTDGKADGGPALKTCFSCHAPAKDRDFVFTRYSR